MKMNDKIAAVAAFTIMIGSVHSDVFWNGSVSSDWVDVKNWTGGAPSGADAGNVVINPGSPFAKPAVKTPGVTTAGPIYLSTGAGLSVENGGELTATDLVTGNWGDSSTVSVTGGALNLRGILNLGAGGHDGDVKVSGGTVTASGLSINGVSGATLDISGSGCVILPSSQLKNIDYWVANNYITANSGVAGWSLRVDSQSQPDKVTIKAVNITPLTDLIPGCDKKQSQNGKPSDSCRGGYQYFVGIVGNPSVPDISWSDEELDKIKDLGVNMVQLSIAWGGKPADEVLNLEDLDDPGQREKFKFRIAQAKKHGLKTIAHFGIPKVVNANPVRPACILDPEVQKKTVTRIKNFLTDFPGVDDVLVYTFDQQAWLCSEFGPCPRCSGIPVGERLPAFLDLLNDAMRSVRPNSRLWWKPWELSRGQVVTVLERVKAEGFGLALNPSTSNEVYPFNDRSFASDLGVKRMVRSAYERGIPVMGEFDHTFYKPLYAIEDYFPRLIYEQMRGWKEMEGVVAVKEYYGFAPSTFSVNCAMLKAWMRSPDAKLDTLLEEIAAPYGKAAAPLMIQAWEYVAQSVEAFPWDTTYLIGPMGLDRGSDGSHDWKPVTISSGSWDTPIWQANRRGNFMLTDEPKAHPWVFEDAGLRLEDSAALAFKAVSFFEKAIAAGGDRTDDIRIQMQTTLRMARSIRMKSLHFLQTLATQNARMVQNDPKQFSIVVKHLEGLLKKDVENQGGSAEVAQKLAELQRDPKAWIKSNYVPFEYETKTTIDWSRWIPQQN
jgi:hypothetical protein